MRPHHAVPLILSLSLASQAYAQSAYAPPPGRLLASNCFQCHGTNGRAVAGFEALAGKSAKEIYSELTEMRRPGEDKGIMTVHALGYTDAQLRAIANYLGTQPR